MADFDDNQNPYRPGEGASDQAFHVPQGAPQPTSVKVFGILNLVFGIWGVFGTLMSVIGIAVMFFADQQGAINGQNIWATMTQNNQVNGVFIVLSMILGSVFSVVLIVAGVSLLRSKKRGRTLSIVYAWFTIVFQVLWHYP